MRYKIIRDIDCGRVVTNISIHKILSQSLKETSLVDMKVWFNVRHPVKRCIMDSIELPIKLTASELIKH